VFQMFRTWQPPFTSQLSTHDPTSNEIHPSPPPTRFRIIQCPAGNSSYRCSPRLVHCSQGKLRFWGLVRATCSQVGSGIVLGASIRWFRCVCPHSASRTLSIEAGRMGQQFYAWLFTLWRLNATWIIYKDSAPTAQ
jgi:hypothetical protein